MNHKATTSAEFKVGADGVIRIRAVIIDLEVIGVLVYPSVSSAVELNHGNKASPVVSRISLRIDVESQLGILVPRIIDGTYVRRLAKGIFHTLIAISRLHQILIPGSGGNDILVIGAKSVDLGIIGSPLIDREPGWIALQGSVVIRPLGHGIAVNCVFRIFRI